MLYSVLKAALRRVGVKYRVVLTLIDFQNFHFVALRLKLPYLHTTAATVTCSHQQAIVLTSLAIVLDGRPVSGQTVPALKPQLLILQLHLGQVLLDVDGRLLGVGAGWKLLGPVVLV